VVVKLYCVLKSGSVYSYRRIAMSNSNVPATYDPSIFRVDCVEREHGRLCR